MSIAFIGLLSYKKAPYEVKRLPKNCIS